MVIKNFLSLSQCKSIIDSLPPQTKVLDQDSVSELNVWYRNKITEQRIAIEPISNVVENLKDYFEYKDCIINKMYITKYDAGQFCKPHYDPVYMTAIILLNDEFTGGNFFLENSKIILSVGDAILFNNKSLHSVSKITSGTRYAMSAWFKRLS